MELLTILILIMLEILPIIVPLAIIVSIVLLCSKPSVKEPKVVINQTKLKRLLVAAEKGDKQAQSAVQKIISKEKLSEEKVNVLLFDAYTEMAQNGDADAMYRLSFEYGAYGKFKDKNKYIYWIENAANQGHIQAMLDMSNAYSELYNSQEVIPMLQLGIDREKQFYWVKKAADTGNGDALIELGDYYYMVEDKIDESIDCYLKALAYMENKDEYIGYIRVAEKIAEQFRLKYDMYKKDDDFNKADLYYRKILYKGIRNYEDVIKFHDYYVKAAKELGGLYYGRYRRNKDTEIEGKKNGRLAAYCFALACYKDVDNAYRQYLEQDLKFISVFYTQEDLLKWKEHAKEYKFYPEKL